jgi:3-dehydroquinate dehydratase-1
METSLLEFNRIARKAKEADLIEVRADSIKELTPERIKELLKCVNDASGKEIILTIRPGWEGGAYQGREHDRRMLLEAGLLEADYIDLELKMPSLAYMLEKAKRSGTKIIISHHNFSGTPETGKMLRLLKEELDLGADIAKLAVKANHVKDVLSLLETTLKASREGRVCTISMGEHGKLARVAAPFFGSSLVYGYVSKPTAPGQLSVTELRDALKILEA